MKHHTWLGLAGLLVVPLEAAVFVRLPVHRRFLLPLEDQVRQSEQRSFTAGENEAEVAEVAEVGEVGEVGGGRLPWILHEWIMEIDCRELLFSKLVYVDGSS